MQLADEDGGSRTLIQLVARINWFNALAVLTGLTHLHQPRQPTVQSQPARLRLSEPWQLLELPVQPLTADLDCIADTASALARRAATNVDTSVHTDLLHCIIYWQFVIG